MKSISLKEIYRFLTDNSHKKFEITSNTNCVIAQILKSRGVKKPHCWMPNPSFVEYADGYTVEVPASWNKFNEDVLKSNPGRKYSASVVMAAIREFSGKSEKYFLS